MSKRQRITINYGDSIGLTARIEDRTAQAVTSPDVDEVCVDVINLDSELTIYEACGSDNSGSTDTDLLPSNVLYDSLQTDDSWTVDSVGYNFEHTLDGSMFTTPNDWYLVRYTVTFANGDIRTLEWDIFVRDQATD